MRGTIHFVSFLICLYFGWFFHRNRPAEYGNLGLILLDDDKRRIENPTLKWGQ